MLETFMNERYSIFENDKQVASGLTAEEMLAFCKENITDETKRLVIIRQRDQETVDKSVRCSMSEREKLIEIIISSFDYCSKFYAALIADYLLSHGVTVPVRCGECCYYRQNTKLALSDYMDENFYCVLHRSEFTENGYCSYGERKENG